MCWEPLSIRRCLACTVSPTARLSDSGKLGLRFWKIILGCYSRRLWCWEFMPWPSGRVLAEPTALRLRTGERVTHGPLAEQGEREMSSRLL